MALRSNAEKECQFCAFSKLIHYITLGRSEQYPEGQTLTSSDPNLQTHVICAL